MPICTHLAQHEFLEPTSNEQLNELLKSVREETDEDWRVEERIYVPTQKILSWKREKPIHTYTLYLGVGHEFQVINFYRDYTSWSINPSVPSELIMAFLFGVLAGCHEYH